MHILLVPTSGQRCHFYILRFACRTGSVLLSITPLAIIAEVVCTGSIHKYFYGGHLNNSNIVSFLS